MIECPSCSHQEFVGTLYCSECGSRLMHSSPVPTVEIPPEEMEDHPQAENPSPATGPDLKSGAIMGLRVVETGEVISLIGRDNFTLGRAAKGQAVVPDIDLDRYQAYDHGVSRIHAEIRLTSEGVEVTDLDSVNGTIVNGEQVPSQESQTLRHGDTLQLGQLHLQLISRQRN